MKQKTFYLFMLASVITLATGLLVSCEKDLCKDSPTESNSYITFSEPEIEKMHVADVTAFLRNSHDSYLYSLLPELEREINLVLAMME